MMHLAWPWMFLALPLPWLLARLLTAVQPRGEALFLPFATAVSADWTPGARNLSPVRTSLLVLCWLLLLCAAARPQWLGEPQAVATTGRRLLVAVDVSGSMATQDMAGGTTRLEAVRQVAGDFIRRRHGDQVGLILFGTRPYLQAPITADLNTVQQFLSEAMIGIAGTQTAIGDAIGLAIKRLKDAPSDSPSQTSKKGETVMVLLTDGGNDAGVMEPLDAAKIAAEMGLRIYTIGIGAAAQPGFMGSRGNTDLDEDTLKAIAHTTGGMYFRATDEQALQAVYAKIAELEPSTGREQWYRPSTEWFTWPLALALLLSIPAVLMRGRA
jgi:Ca-activated chloride channel family protein